MRRVYTSNMNLEKPKTVMIVFILATNKMESTMVQAGTYIQKVMNTKANSRMEYTMAKDNLFMVTLV